jgi:hypothetical protein
MVSLKHNALQKRAREGGALLALLKKNFKTRLPRSPECVFSTQPSS